MTTARSTIIKKAARDASGMSLIETTVAIALSGIVILGAAEGMIFFTNSSKKLSSKSLIDINAKSFGQSLTAIIESAFIASQYQHLPISVNCPPSSNPAQPIQKPCVRQLKPDGTFSTSTPAGLNISSTLTNIEFFRDDDPGKSGSPGTGLYAPQSAWGAAKGNGTVQATQPLNLSTNDRTGGYYTTWPLVDDTSSPLVMLRSSGMSSYFKIDQSTESTTLTNPYAFFKSTTPLSANDLANLKGSLLLIYNAYVPNQFSVQYINDIVECWPKGATASPCQALIYWKQPADPAIPNIIAQWQLQATAGTDVEYAMDLRAIAPGSTQESQRFITSYQPALSSFGVTFGTNWGNNAVLKQNAGLYSFPSNVFSLVDSSDATDFPKSALADVRRMLHYYDTVSNAAGSASSLPIGLPVTMTAYYLKLNKAATDKAIANAKQAGLAIMPPTIYSLVSSSFNYHNDAAPIPGSATGDPEFTLLDQVNGMLMFARQLGSNSMSLYVYQNAQFLTRMDLNELEERRKHLGHSGEPAFAGFWQDRGTIVPDLELIVRGYGI